jgi:hypothetical protein
MGTMKASLGTLVALATLAERAQPGLAGSNFAGDEVGTLFGFLGAASALIFSCAPHHPPFRALSLWPAGPLWSSPNESLEGLQVLIEHELLRMPPSQAWAPRMALPSPALELPPWVSCGRSSL